MHLDRVRDGVRLQLMHLDPSPGHRCRQRALEQTGELRGVLFVRHLDGELGVVQLLELGRQREPKSWASAADKAADRAQNLAWLAGPMRVLSTVFFRHLVDNLLGTEYG